jgi:nucleoid-associated protein YgaU
MTESTVHSPDVSQIKLADLKERPFPSLSDYRITISDTAYKDIHKHSGENTAIELCGVLVGEVFKDKDGPFLDITDIIRGEKAENQGAQVTFTHETWSHIYEIKDSRFPDKLIVGWYHTHPRFGIFLSEQDLFIHQNFFNQPWQVAFVVDPLSGDEGFFVWYNGTPSRVDDYRVAGRKVKQKAIENPGRTGEPVVQDNDNMKEPQHFHVYIFLIIVLSSVFIYLIMMDRSLKEQLVSQEEYLAGISNKHSLPSLPDQGKKYIKEKNVKDALAQNIETAGLSIKIEQKQNHVWCSGEVSTWYQKELIGKVVGSVQGVESVDLQGIDVTHRYVTMPGDSLSKIAGKVYGNPENWQEIYKINRDKIIDPHKIRPSITLILPGNFYE